MTEVCFNCQLPGHISEFCPDPPKKTRCPSCKKVDFHTPDCKNNKFKSQYTSTSTTVFKMLNQLKLDFQHVESEFKVQDFRREVPIGPIPLWLSVIDAHVGQVGARSLEFATSRPMKRNITFIDQNNKPILSFVFYCNVLIINERFEINEKGNISFNVNARNEIKVPIVCEIRLRTIENPFKMRVTWYGHKHVFQVHPIIGPILIDPQQPIPSPSEAKYDTVNVRINAIDRSDEGAVGGIDPNERTFAVKINLRNISTLTEDELGAMLKDLVVSLKRPAIAAKPAHNDNEPKDE